MKKHLMFTLMVLLISLLAFGAYAQSQGEPEKPQNQTQTQTKPADPIRERTDTGPQGKGTMTTDRTRTDEGPKKGSADDGLADKASGESGVKPQTQTQTKPADPVRERTDQGPQGKGTMTTDRVRTDEGPKKGSADDGLAEKASGEGGSKPQTQTQTKPADPIRDRKDQGPQGNGTMTTDRTRTDEGPKKGSADDGLADKASGEGGSKPQTQTQTKPADPIRERTDTGPQGKGTMTTDRTRTDMGPMKGSGGDGLADKAGEDCDGTQQRDRTRDGMDVDGHGGTNRHGVDIDGEGGPHHLGNNDDFTKAGGGDADGEQDQDRVRTRTWLVESIEGHGGINRHGVDINGLGGPHNLGQEDDLLKIFGDESSGSLSGLRHIWGPATAGGGPFGPNLDGVGYGPGGPETSEDKVESVVESRGARRGRK